MKVLMLDHQYGVHNVVPWQEAAVKYILGKAKKPSGHDDVYEIRTANGVFELPTVLVLVTRIKLPFKRVAVNKENVLRRDGYECGYCGTKLTNGTGTIDHVHPTSRGGKHTWTNVVAACKECNNRKGNKTLTELEDEALNAELDELERAENEGRDPRPVKALRLRTKPFVPTRDVMLVTSIDLRTNEAWGRWVH